jgi:hypothetical protein
MLRRTLFATVCAISLLFWLACGDAGENVDNPPGGTPSLGSGGSGGEPVATLEELAGRYNTVVHASLDLPYSAPAAFVDSDGNLQAYAYDLLDGLVTLYAARGEPADVDDYRTGADDDARRSVVRRTETSIAGRKAVLVQEQFEDDGQADSLRLLWVQDGYLLQLLASTAGIRGQQVAIDPNALFKIAEQIRTLQSSDGLIEDLPLSTHRDYLGGAVRVFSNREDATAFVPSDTEMPRSFSLMTVVSVGASLSFSADLTKDGFRRLYLVPAELSTFVAADGPTVRESAQVGGRPAFYERTDTENGTVSQLFFSTARASYMIRDSNGATLDELVAAAGGLFVAPETSN